MQHMRTSDAAGRVYQWVDAQRCYIADLASGKHLPFGPRMHMLGTLEEALAHVAKYRGWEEFLVIVRVDCIAAYLVDGVAVSPTDRIEALGRG